MLLPINQLGLVSRVGPLLDALTSDLVIASQMPNGRCYAKTLGKLNWPTWIPKFPSEWPHDHDVDVLQIVSRGMKQTFIDRVTKQPLVLRTVAVSWIQPRCGQTRSNHRFSDGVAIQQNASQLACQILSKGGLTNTGGSCNDVKFSARHGAQ